MSFTFTIIYLKFRLFIIYRIRPNTYCNLWNNCWIKANYELCGFYRLIYQSHVKWRNPTTWPEEFDERGHASRYTETNKRIQRLKPEAESALYTLLIDHTLFRPYSCAAATAWTPSSCFCMTLQQNPLVFFFFRMIPWEVAPAGLSYSMVRINQLDFGELWIRAAKKTRGEGINLIHFQRLIWINWSQPLMLKLLI